MYEEFDGKNDDLTLALKRLRWLLDRLKDENVDEDERIELIEKALFQVERCQDLLSE